jgi:RNA polymerase sigma-70 factor (ECF subfamily)
MDDLRVIERVRSGDREAFRVLVERHAPVVFALLRQILPGAHDREDAAQDAFLTAFAKLDRYDAARGTFRAWLLTIARNRALNARKRRTPEPSATAAERAVAPERDDGAFESLDRALAGLPESLRSTFVLAEIHELPYEEVSGIEGVPIGTVKSRVHRARERLRTALSRAEEER